MTRHYSTRDFFRNTPNALLARYFAAARGGGQDLAELHEVTRGYSRADEESLVLDTLKIIADNWAAIDGAAAFLLAYGSASGVVTSKKLSYLSRLLDRDGLQYRSPYIPLPWQYSHPPTPLLRE